MPYANNNGVKIYYEVEGEGPPLVLAHGVTRALDAWRAYGYAEALKNDFKLVLFDARGHGRSDKPHDTSAYTSKLRVGDVLTVLDEIGIGKAHYFGYSMGARLGFRVATSAAARFHSFIFGGNSPYRSEAENKANQDSLDTYKIMLADPEAAVRQRERAFGRPMTNEERALYLANDAEALVALGTAHLAWPPLTNDELSNICVPCLLYCGDLDLRYAGAKESASHIPQATFISLPGLDHTPVFVRSDAVLPHVKKFLAEVSKNQA